MNCITKLICIALASFVFACSAPEADQSSWSLVDIPAPSLENNLLESDSSKTIGVYLPPSYQSNIEKQYPVVYYLEGYGGAVYDQGYTCWVLDSLIHEQQVPEMIFVNISGRYTFHGSFYENSPVTGNWADFVTKDVIDYVDKNYRTIATAESRAITGHSMGGYGSLNIGMLHPDKFKVVYGMSPGLFDEDGLANSQLFRNGGTVQPVLNLLKELEPLNKEEAHKAYMSFAEGIEDWNIEFTLAYGMTFAPNTNKAPYFDYPITINGSDTIIDIAIWNKWAAGFGNVKNEVEDNTSNLKSLKLLAIDCGYNDDFRWIAQGTKYYDKVLTDQQIQHLMYWHKGTHGSLFTQSVRYGLFPSVAAYLKHQ